MQLVCPHCHNPLEQAENGTTEIVCPTCGSSFRLERERTRSYTEDHRRLDKFELLEQVGVGAFGVVWKAYDADLNRMVAVKIPHPGRVVTPQDEERFVREGRSAAQLRHPGIVSVHQVGRHERVPYLVADFIEGVTLADLLSSRRPGIRQAAEIVAQIAEALDYAHTMGVVHRDIKPSNIMLERPSARGTDLKSVLPQGDAGPAIESGKPMLMDFGLALRDEVEVTMTQDGQILGTPAYMSPEQAAGLSHRLDARSDIYSLGVVLYQLLTGELPFRGNSRMQMEQVLREEPRPPRRLNDQIPRDLETICLKAMAKEPARRYATARALSDDLRRFLKGEPILARPISAWERGLNWVKRRPAIAGLLVASGVAALALVGLIVGAIYSSRLKGEYDKTDRALKGEEEQRRRAETTLYFNRIVLAEREWYANRVSRAMQLLDECPPEMRGWEWNYLKRLGHAELFSLRGHTMWVDAVAYSPDGRRLASGSGDESVIIWNPLTGQQIRALPIGYKVESLAFSPDGKHLAVGEQTFDSQGASQITIWNIDEAKKVQAIHGSTGWVKCVTFSSDGRLLASTSLEKVVRLWDPVFGKPIRTFSYQDELLCGVAFSPDGKYLAAGCGTGNDFGEKTPGKVIVWNVMTGKELVAFQTNDRGITWVAFSPDGKQIASAGFDHTVSIRDATTGKEIRTFRGHTMGVLCVVYSPDGKMIASSGEDGLVIVWNVETGKPIRTLRGHAGGIYSIAFCPVAPQVTSAGNDGLVKIWDVHNDPNEKTLRAGTVFATSVSYSPDGKKLATTSMNPTTKIWDTVTAQKPTEIHGHKQRVWRLVFSPPDGRRMASASEDGTARVWDTPTGKELFTLRGHTKWVQDVAYSPDGRQIATAGGDNTVIVWDATIGRLLFPLEGHTERVWSVAFSPDGRYLASAGDRTIRLWELASKKQVRVFTGHTDEVTRVVFSPDGTRLASACQDRTVRIWDVSGGKTLFTLRGHSTYVYGLAYSPDGSRLASASFDETVKIWDPMTGEEFLTLRGNDGFYFVAFSPDGRQIAACNRDGTVKIWNATPLEEKPNLIEP